LLSWHGLMAWIRNPLFAVLFSTAYLVANMFVGPTHRHCDQGCAHSDIHSDCHDGHEHGCPGEEIETASAHPHSLPLAPAHDEDDCLVCRYLAKPPLPPAFVEVPHVVGSVGLLDLALPAEDIAAPLSTHHSRAPPA